MEFKIRARKDNDEYGGNLQVRTLSPEGYRNLNLKIASASVQNL